MRDDQAERALCKVREIFRPGLNSLTEIIHRVESSEIGRVDLIRRLRHAAGGVSGPNWRKMALDRAIAQAAASVDV